MPNISSSELIAQFQTALREGWGYIYGASGEIWTQAQQNAASREQTKKYGQKWVGHRVADCSGLFAWAFPGRQAAGCAAVTAEHGVAAVIAVPAELPKRPRKKAGAVRHAVSDPFLTIFLCLFTARGVLLCLRPDFARRAVDVPPAIAQRRLELRNQLGG